ncbi:MAG: FAD-binding domain-containing protein [Flavobacteriales bacterium]|jgi:deoxyribodipyrimidine photo-lyase|tara:strand:- start:9903 stop:11045 length:1143 start_codon:yes stop_codon:yes gene_type:complete
MNFTTDYNEVVSLLDKIDPSSYAKSRNYIDGAVTRLSPYISRGVISTKQVLERTLERGFEQGKMEKFTQELAWRDHWQQNWIAKGRDINLDLKRTQTPVSNTGFPTAVLNAHTGIDGIDQGIQELYATGYMHNHVRMYTAAIVCNMAYSHWLTPSRWMYFNLLDADWASNALSWQWVAGTNANKKYVANQENINSYCHTSQHDTFLDVDYSVFKYPNYEENPPTSSPPAELDYKTPDELMETKLLTFITPLPKKTTVIVLTKIPTYIYNWYNLDPKWDSEIRANRILLLEPSIFEEYPISEKSVAFMLNLGKNIADLQVYVGEFSKFVEEYQLKDIHFKEHPLNSNYRGTEHSRDWMFDIKGFHSSFFGFWKKAKKQLRY